jgi:hypothetical protein
MDISVKADKPCTRRHRQDLLTNPGNFIESRKWGENSHTSNTWGSLRSNTSSLLRQTDTIRQTQTGEDSRERQAGRNLYVFLVHPSEGKRLINLCGNRILHSDLPWDCSRMFESSLQAGASPAYSPLYCRNTSDRTCPPKARQRDVIFSFTSGSLMHFPICPVFAAFLHPSFPTFLRAKEGKLPQFEPWTCSWFLLQYPKARVFPTCTETRYYHSDFFVLACLLHLGLSHPLRNLNLAHEALPLPASLSASKFCL